MSTVRYNLEFICIEDYAVIVKKMKGRKLRVDSSEGVVKTGVRNAGNS